ncbi:MAG: hypothetical protein K6A63_04805 [Acholeplasmatales bacterium]|nr:hypothetical protein [Acholeplasmatales bacterium]
MAQEANNVEVVENTTEKKENGFSKFFNKAKASVAAAQLENKIEAAYKKDTITFANYEKDSLLPKTYYGKYLSDNQIEVFGDHEAKVNTIIISEKDEKAYYVTSTEKTTVKSTVEGTEYERPGTIINLDTDVTEVNVIKAGKRYFIYKEIK